MFTLLWILLNLLIISRKGECLVLTQESIALSLPYDYPVAAAFFHLVAVDEVTGQNVQQSLLFQILRTAAFPPESKPGRGLFTVDRHTGALMLSPHRRHALKEYQGSTFALDIVVSSASRPGAVKNGEATVLITITNDSFQDPQCFPRREYCFSSSEMLFQLPETAPNGTFAGNIKPSQFFKLCSNLKVAYTIQAEAPLSFISPSSGEMRTNTDMDYETKNYYSWNVTCHISSESINETYLGQVSLSVLDVDDNPPYVQNIENTEQELDASDIIPNKPVPVQLTVMDRDTSIVNNITVGVLDPLNLFHLRDPVLFHGVNGTYMLLNAVLVAKSPFSLPELSYNISVLFEDRNLITDEDNKVVFHIRIYNYSHAKSLEGYEMKSQEYKVATTVFRRTSHHARVIQPMEVRRHDGYFFRLSGDPDDSLTGSRIFGVTPSTGIVYVRDEVALSRYPEDRITLNLTWRTKRETDRYCNILIHILDSGDPTSGCGLEPGRIFQTCALHDSAESCTTSCGRGSMDGYCQWRSHPLHDILTKRYATCSPDLETCPDGTCDELELRDPFICPQDCTRSVRGEAILGISGRGIGYSAAPCKCEGRGGCTCIRNYLWARNSTQKLTSRSRLKEPEPVNARLQLIKQESTTAKGHHHENWSHCGGICVAMIASVSIIVSSLILFAGFLICRQHLKKFNKNTYIPSCTPLTTSNSEYMDNTESFAENVQSETLLEPERDNCPSIDSHLEFPRDRLILEEIIGEGEFGRVVKAKARDIAEFKGLMTVAVKMLKENGTESEEKDLLSELNLLREISHPNVIRLLGVCTRDGPLFLIVEYAEHGSLRSYLRKLRAHNPSYLNVENDGYLQNNVSFMKELVSFAWQVAKGMAYLADMKLVHRDLAARNVLVAAGKVLKISDFGLSRDVYEGNTYLKRTRGRVPVKWMALESLEDHIYTTKSDMWSYGIVLWEIFTLGASPYPGIAAESLYHLLKGGYRMTKPENCPSQIYRIATWCWRERPQERPSFKELVQRLETIINENIDYLPLSETSERPEIINASRDKITEVPKNKIPFPKIRTLQREYENRQLLATTEYNV